MKKILTTLLFLSIATLVIMGCSLIFGTTYSVTSDDEGYCWEVTTSEVGTILLLDAAGALEEPCEIEAAATCTFESDEYSQEVINYYSTEYLELTPEFKAELKADCLADDGKWKEL